MNNRKKLTTILSVLIVAVFCLTVVFAALGQNLISTFGSGSSAAIVQKGASWNVGFETASSVTATKTGYSGVTCGNATVSATAVTIPSVALYTPGDSCTWNVTIKNTGGLKAKLKSFTWTQPTGATCTSSSTGTYVCGNVTYSVLKGDAVLAVGEQLPASTGSVAVKIKVEIPSNKSISSSDVTHYNGKVQLNWEQD